jgi:2-hydroxy-6-oxonona-2,4-dienedioate hydrolase
MERAHTFLPIFGRIAPFMKDQIIEEGKFRYIESGEGSPLILLHGLFGALSNFKEVVDHFSGRYKVVIPMLPLYELPVLDTNAKRLARFLHEFIKFKGYTDVNLLGNSLGGHVALIYTKNHLENVRSLTLTASSGLYENAFGSSFPRREDKEFIRQKVALTFYDSAHASDELVDECFSIVNDRNRVLRILAIAKSAIRHNMAKDLAKMDIPACLIWGKNDTITPPEVAEEFHEKLPNSSLYWIDKCGHAPMMEHPVEFNSILDKWLAEQGL